MDDIDAWATILGSSGDKSPLLKLSGGPTPFEERLALRRTLSVPFDGFEQGGGLKYENEAEKARLLLTAGHEANDLAIRLTLDHLN
jgi:hypothetical protein